MVNFWNLWIFFVLGYGTIWLSMILANRKRGKPIEDHEYYKMPNSKKCGAIGIIHLLISLLVSILTPVDFGFLFWIGLPLYIAGILLNIISMYSFAHFTGGVNISGIYRFSRNPMYIGGFLFLLGLCLMGWTASVWSIIFLILFILYLPYCHWAVLIEESFLEQKYGDEYHEYLNKVPRYIGKKRL